MTATTRPPASPTLTSLPDGRRGQILALGLTVVGLGVLWSAISGLVGLYQQGARDLADRRDVLAHTRALVDSLPDLTLRARNLSRAAQGSTLLIAETSQETALARLQQIAHDTAVQNGITPTSMEPLPVAQTGRFERLGVHLTASTSYTDLVQLLQALAQGSAPRLIVEDLHIALSDDAAGATSAPSQSRLLDISLTIVALRDPSIHVAAPETSPSSSSDTGATH